ncbi:MAG: protein translocase subunit SecD [bacterium]|nr:protein translocase subunit SecD [bacterium]
MTNKYNINSNPLVKLEKILLQYPTVRKHPGLSLSIIILLAVVAGVFIYPSGFGLNNRPWRLGLDLVGGSHLIYQVDLSAVSKNDQDSVLNGLRDVIEKRVNLFGVAEPQVFIAKETAGTNLIVELAGVKNISEAIKQIGETPLLDFREVQLGESATSTSFLETSLTGRFVTGAQLTFDQTTQSPQVSISFNDEGAKLFEDITERNVGQPLAIFLDGSLIEAPVVQTKISGGQAVITGSFSLADAKTLVERFNAGALPAPVTLINQQTISSSLGEDSLRNALVAGTIGALLVIIFMLIYYRYFGVFASIALIIYIVFTLAVFKIIPITVTLAGLAGLIITIGMAVDANILIFERIKEELKKGLSRTSAIEEGFRRAWLSIRDSNMSSAITAIILYSLTSSFVKGFAVSLLIGVLVSMFSAITTTRVLIRVFIKDTPTLKKP